MSSKKWDDIEKQREAINNSLGSPDKLRFPENWNLSKSWQRAQKEKVIRGPINPAEWKIKLGLGEMHTSMMAIKDSDVIAGCDCKGFRHRGFCAHVANLWWSWVREKIAVTDLDTGVNYTSPPLWVRVEDKEKGAKK